MVKTGSNDFQDLFLILGAQKAGTASLDTFLSLHPRLRQARRKEVNYFSSDILYARGINWYRNQFPGFREKKIGYESTPEYLYYPFVPARIQAFNPRLKMIVLLREPVERAYSAWNMFKRIYETNKEKVIDDYFSLTNPDIRNAMTAFLRQPHYPDFRTCVADDMARIAHPPGVLEPSFTRRGIYVEQLERYYRCFSRRQILVIESKELRVDKVKTLNKISTFLEIPPFAWDEELLNNAHEGQYDSSPDPETMNMLKEFYAPYNKSLYELLNRKFEW